MVVPVFLWRDPLWAGCISWAAPSVARVCSLIWPSLVQPAPSPPGWGLRGLDAISLLCRPLLASPSASTCASLSFDSAAGCSAFLTESTGSFSSSVSAKLVCLLFFSLLLVRIQISPSFLGCSPCIFFGCSAGRVLAHLLFPFVDSYFLAFSRPFALLFLRLLRWLRCQLTLFPLLYSLLLRSFSSFLLLLFFRICFVWLLFFHFLILLAVFPHSISSLGFF